MSAPVQATFNQLCQYARETALLESISSLLNWDERTLLPSAAGAYRAEQVTYLSTIIHERRTHPQVGEWLQQLIDSPLGQDRESDEGATIRELKHDYDKAVKLPPRLVEELARTAVLGQQAWVEARSKDDYAAFEPFLSKTLTLKREQASALGYKAHPYDALLDDFEPGATTAQVEKVLEGLRRDLVPLVAALAESNSRPRRELLRRHYPRAQQEQFGKQIAERIGFSFARGRLDVTHHPFCSTMGPDDCRITTRYDESYFSSAFFGILHEAGHGLYEQGLRTDQYGLPPGMFASLGLHESQSRLWENFVGRSWPFWRHCYPEAQRIFPESLSDVALDDFYFAFNDVHPSLIRVEADEATYNLHIIIRFELEQALITDDLRTGDLPSAWNEKYKKQLGITPQSNADGVLQDIHWSAGLFGYFPTYSLGNLYAAQLFAAADKALGGLGEQFANGDFAPLLNWLRENIHHQGRKLPANELVERVTGQPLSPDALINHLRAKFAPLYHI